MCRDWLHDLVCGNFLYPFYGSDLLFKVTGNAILVALETQAAAEVDCVYLFFTVVKLYQFHPDSKPATACPGLISDFLDLFETSLWALPVPLGHFRLIYQEPRVPMRVLSPPFFPSSLNLEVSSEPLISDQDCGKKAAPCLKSSRQEKNNYLSSRSVPTPPFEILFR